MKTAPCRGCGQEIAFIRMASGKSMPVDPKPMLFIPSGGPNTYVMPDGSIQRGREIKYGDTEQQERIGYRSHFATCPADRFRGK